MKAVVGVIPLWDDKRESIWILPGYLEAIKESGAIPILLPLDSSAEDIEQLCGVCSGFLLTGGHDVDPALYGAERGAKCGVACERRDRLEREVFDYALERDLPILGICRGIQLINAFCGGTLYQDLPSEYDSRLCHQMRPPYDAIIHSVRVVEGTPLSKITKGAQSLGVNSYHHQAIRTLAPTLEAMAIAEDGLIEAVYMPQQSFVIALQWHPEFNYHTSESSRQIMRAFVMACEERI